MLIWVWQGDGASCQCYVRISNVQYILTPLPHVPRFPPLFVIFVREKEEEKASPLSWASYVGDIYLWAFAPYKSPSKES